MLRKPFATLAACLGFDHDRIISLLPVNSSKLKGLGMGIPPRYSIARKRRQLSQYPFRRAGCNGLQRSVHPRR